MSSFFEDLFHVQVGDKVHLFGEKNPYKVMARSERFVILSKNCFGNPLYTIIDLREQWMGPDFLIFGIYDYSNTEDCKKAVEALEKGDLEISRRRGISFDSYKEIYA